MPNQLHAKPLSVPWCMISRLTYRTSHGPLLEPRSLPISVLWSSFAEQECSLAKYQSDADATPPNKLTHRDNYIGAKKFRAPTCFDASQRIACPLDGTRAMRRRGQVEGGKVV